MNECGSPDGDGEVAKAIETFTQDWVEQEMVEAVTGLRQLENGSTWTATNFDDALSPVALTAAFMADRHLTLREVPPLARPAAADACRSRVAAKRPAQPKSAGPALFADVPESRRVIMRANRRRDSAPELALRSALHRIGLRYRVDAPIRVGASRPIRPDVVFGPARLAVFVDGCFWHGCPIHGTRSATRADYWGPKIAENQVRDARQKRLLESAGWQVIRVWEHEDPSEAAARIRALLGR